MYRRNNRTAINSLFKIRNESSEPQTLVSEITDINTLNNKIETLKKNKKLELLKSFLDINVKFDDEEFILMTDLRKKFKEYCYNLNKNNLDNMNYNLSKDELIKQDPRFKIKYYSFCKSCNQRYHYGCCNENNRLNRCSKEVVLYMKLRNS